MMMYVKNKWMKLREYMENAIILGCTDDEKLKRVALRYALTLFSEDGKYEIDRKLYEEIKAHISSFLYRIRAEVRKAGEPYEKVTLEVVRERLREERLREEKLREKYGLQK